MKTTYVTKYLHRVEEKDMYPSRDKRVMDQQRCRLLLHEDLSKKYQQTRKIAARKKEIE